MIFGIGCGAVEIKLGQTAEPGLGWRLLVAKIASACFLEASVYTEHVSGETTTSQSRRDFLALTAGWSLCGLPQTARDLAGIEASQGELPYPSRMGTS